MPIGPLTYNGQATLRGERASKTLCAVYLAYSVFTNKHNKSLGRRMLFDKLGRKYLTPHVATIKAAPESDDDSNCRVFYPGHTVGSSVGYYDDDI